MEIGDLVCVRWLDAHGSAANVAYELDEIPHLPIEVTSYGLLLKDDEVGVSIASEVCDKNIYRGYGFMPRVLIVKVEKVKKSRIKKAPSTGPAHETTPPALSPPAV